MKKYFLTVSIVLAFLCSFSFPIKAFSETFQNYIIRAYEHLQAGNMQKGFAEFDAGIKAYPDVPEIRSKYGMNLFQEKKVPESISVLKEAVNIFPNNSELLYFLSAACFTNAETSSGKTYMSRYTALHPDKSVTYLRLMQMEGAVSFFKNKTDFSTFVDLMYASAIKEGGSKNEFQVFKQNFQDIAAAEGELDKKNNASAFRKAESALKVALQNRLLLNQRYCYRIMALVKENTDKTAYLDFMYKSASNLSSIEYFSDAGAVYNVIGETLFPMEKYSEAQKAYNDSAENYLKAGYRNEACESLISAGVTAGELGNPPLQLKFYNKALSLCENKIPESEMRLYSKLAGYYITERKYDTAKKYLDRGYKIAVDLKSDFEKAACSTQYGNLYLQTGNIPESRKYFTEALDIFTRLNKPVHIAAAKQNLALTFKNSSSAESEKMLKEAAESMEKSGKSDKELVTVLYNIGNLYVKKSDFNSAIQYMKKAAAVVERIKKGKSDIEKAGLSQNYNYINREIAGLHYIMKEPKNAFYSRENYLSQYLSEMLSASGKNFPSGSSWLESYLDNLPDDCAIVGFSIITGDFAGIFYADKKKFLGDNIDLDKFRKNIYLKNQSKIDQYISGSSRGFSVKIKGKDNNTPASENYASFEKIINYYRHLFENPQSASRDNPECLEISREIYKLLFSKISDQLDGKTKLIIIPDGIFGFIPFDALITDDGKYFAEKIETVYSQSMKITLALNNRKYSDSRKNLLALGGADYSAYNNYTPRTEFTDLALASSLIPAGTNMFDIYKAVGITSWSFLKGTSDEITSISKLITTDTLSGKNASEEKIHSMSRSGELSRFKIIHFATHGMVVPENPSLSAIVLSLKNSPSNDGYLNIREAASLKLNADLVTLSACETGLGRIVDGEGVIGLTQSFIMAGANSVVASLWKISDEGTKQYMTGMYQGIKNGENVSKAVCAAKRNMIKSADRNSPYYWAPFVYYGMFNNNIKVK